VASAVSGVIDYLLAQCPAIMQVVDPLAQVSESWPVADAPLLLTIARMAPQSPDGMDLTGSYQIMGARRRTEHVSIPCVIQAAAAGRTGQRDARVKALAAMDAICVLIRQDPTLGGLLIGGVALISSVRYEGTVDAEDATNGRSAQASFVLEFENYYIP
jgi:hypothetical protein